MKNLIIVDRYYIKKLYDASKNGKFPVAKWIRFCKEFVDLGFSVSLYKSKISVSKYIYIKKFGRTKKVRFSNHKPNYWKEKNGDCDYFVGISNSQIITTEVVAKKIKKYFKKIEYEKNCERLVNARKQSNRINNKISNIIFDFL